MELSKKFGWGIVAVSIGGLITFVLQFILVMIGLWILSFFVPLVSSLLFFPGVLEKRRYGALYGVTSSLMGVFLLYLVYLFYLSSVFGTDFYYVLFIFAFFAVILGPIGGIIAVIWRKRKSEPKERNQNDENYPKTIE